MVHGVAKSLSYKLVVDGSRQAAANIKPRRTLPGTNSIPAFPRHRYQLGLVLLGNTTEV